MKIHIKNFQSIEDASLEIPEKSFTCIVGQSNIGKSAIRRALECLVYNKSEVSYIRNGAKSCSVDVTFDDGTSIQWYRDKKTAGYIIDGEDFTKLAGSVPDVLLDKGFKELIINKDKYQVQIASQFNNLFLLNETGGKVTDMLSNLGNLNRIINSNKACQTDLKASKSKLNIRREDIVSAKEKLGSYNGLDGQRFILDSLKLKFKEIKETIQKHSSIKKIEISLNKSIYLVKVLRPIKDVIVEPFDLDLNKIVNLKNLLKKQIRSQDVVSAYSPIKNVSDVEMNLSYDRLLTVKNLFLKYKKIEVKQNDYSKLKNIPSIEFSITDEYTKYAQIKSQLIKLEKIRSKVSLYNNLPTSILDIGDIDLIKVSKLRKLYESLNEKKSFIIELREKSTEIEINLKKLEEDKEELHKTLGVCPLCDKEF